MKKILLIAVVLTGIIAAHAQSVPPLKTIYDIQFVSQSTLATCVDTSQYNNDTVTVRGIVVTDGTLSQAQINNTTREVYIQDGTGAFTGLNIFMKTVATTPVDMRDLFQGDSVEITGVVNDYKGQTEIVSVSYVNVLGSGKAVNYKTINLGDLNDPQRNNILPTGEQWEGSFVEIKNVTVTAVTYFASNTRVSFDVIDGSGNKINVSDRFLVQRLPNGPAPGGTFVAPNVGDFFTSLKGIVLHPKNNCPGFSGRGYELDPFDTSHYSYGSAAPHISNIARQYISPTSSQSNMISCTITSLQGINPDSAFLWYRVAPNTTYTSVLMNSSGSTYSANIPNLPEGSLVEYYLSVTDTTVSHHRAKVPAVDNGSTPFFYTVRDNGLTIYDVQYTPFADGNSGYTGMVVTVSGVVTASSNDLGYVYIQQEGQNSWAGLQVLGNTALSSLNIGDKVTVTGTIEESFNFTRMNNITSVNKTGSGTIAALKLKPSVLAAYSFSLNEMYESMLVKIADTAQVKVVRVNADSPGTNEGDYLIGSNLADTITGTRVLAGRQSSTSSSSLNVSYVNSAIWATVNGTMNVTPIVVGQGDKLDSLLGIVFFDFGNMRVLPRNNSDFYNWNFLVTSLTTQNVNSAQEGAISLIPNPATDNLNIRIKSSSTSGNLRLRIINAIGDEIMEQVMNSDELSLNVSTLPEGYYIVMISSEDGTPQKNKLVINR